MATILNTVRPDPAFDPEAITVLAAAFDEAWDRLRQSGSECVRPAYARAMKEILARRIIEMAQSRHYGPTRASCWRYALHHDQLSAQDHFS